jgi:hypothetical protein
MELSAGDSTCKGIDSRKLRDFGTLNESGLEEQVTRESHQNISCEVEVINSKHLTLKRAALEAAEMQ